MRKPIIAFTADVHLHPFPEGNAPTKSGYGQRVDLTIAAMREMYSYCTQYGIETVIIAGDLLHSKKSVPVHVVQPLLQLFNDYAGLIKTDILVGNHERPDYVSGVTSLDFLRDVAGVNVIDRPVFQQRENLDIMWLPWTHDWKVSLPEATKELLDGHRSGVPRILVGHGAVDGAETASGVALSNPHLKQASLNLQSYNLSFWGDIHGHQPIANNAWYIGALCPQNYGERDIEAGFIVLYDDLSWERVKIATGPRFGYTVSKEDGGVDAGEYTIHNFAATGDKAKTTQFVRVSPEAVGAKVLKEEGMLATNVDLQSLDAMLKGYVEENPLPNGVDYDRVLTSLGEFI